MTPTSREAAARAFQACAGLDPEGLATPESAAACGECFEIETDTGRVFVSISFDSLAAWINAAAGTGQGMTGPGLAAIEREARARGCPAVGFQTLRRGLVRRAKKQGYRITSQVGAGFVVLKALT